MLKYQNYLLPRCIPGCGIGRSASQRSYLAWPVVSALCAAWKKFAPSVPVVIKDVCFVFSGSIDQVEKKNEENERTNDSLHNNRVRQLATTNSSVRCVGEHDHQN